MGINVNSVIPDKTFVWIKGKNFIVEFQVLDVVLVYHSSILVAFVYHLIFDETTLSRREMFHCLLILSLNTWNAINYIFLMAFFKIITPNREFLYCQIGHQACNTGYHIFCWSTQWMLNNSVNWWTNSLIDKSRTFPKLQEPFVPFLDIYCLSVAFGDAKNYFAHVKCRVLVE